MSYDSVAPTLLGIEKMGLPNVGILLDFGHSLYGGESPADAAQLAIDHGRLFGMDVNDNFRSWDDDLIAGSVHPIELFEFFYTLRKNKWEGVRSEEHTSEFQSLMRISYAVFCLKKKKNTI